ncbi:MAG: MogA/MoaB family molybdenum cofactor biosynthesis protein [Halobacteriota archaeon]
MVDFQRRDTQRGETESTDDSATHDHDHHAHDRETVGAAILTVSSSRTLDADPSGEAIRDELESAGHEVVTRELVRDDGDRIQTTANHLIDRGDVDVLITTGGTGVTPDDVTVEAVGPLFEKHLPGFGELFRQESKAEIGSRVVATRATAGVADGVPVFVLPGSVDAVELGLEEIILPEIGHLVGLAQRAGHADH